MTFLQPDIRTGAAYFIERKYQYGTDPGVFNNRAYEDDTERDAFNKRKYPNGSGRTVIWGM